MCVYIYGQGRGVLTLMSGELSMRTASNESHSQQGQKKKSMCVREIEDVFNALDSEH